MPRDVNIPQSYQFCHRKLLKTNDSNYYKIGGVKMASSTWCAPLYTEHSGYALPMAPCGPRPKIPN
ncbi:MAG: hypothetical protein PVF58_03105 [Candidatus Methanofastidiosia archaeon]